jgi:hypothetical protein
MGLSVAFAVSRLAAQFLGVKSPSSNWALPRQSLGIPLHGLGLGGTMAQKSPKVRKDSGHYRSIGCVSSVCHPSTLRTLIFAQNNMAAVSAEGSRVWVLIRRLNASCNHSIAFVVRTLFHWLGGKRVIMSLISA